MTGQHGVEVSNMRLAWDNDAMTVTRRADVHGIGEIDGFGQPVWTPWEITTGVHEYADAVAHDMLTFDACTRFIDYPTRRDYLQAVRSAVPSEAHSLLIDAILCNMRTWDGDGHHDEAEATRSAIVTTFRWHDDDRIPVMALISTELFHVRDLYNSLIQDTRTELVRDQAKDIRYRAALVLEIQRRGLAAETDDDGEYHITHINGKALGVDKDGFREEDYYNPDNDEE